MSVNERRIVVYKSYFYDFYNCQPKNVRNKIDWTLGLIKAVPQIPEQYFKHMEGTRGLYEVRVEVGSNIYRIFSFFDRGNLIVLGNGFQKKSQKTPRMEIDRAIRIMEEYFHEKEDQ